MKTETQSWIEKAEGDWVSGGRELRARKAPNYDDCCFHSQQCAEKYMKAVLVAAGLTFPRTHDLSVLLDLMRPVSHLWEQMRPAATLLSVYGARFRYPGNNADKAMAREAYGACYFIRSRLREYLGLPSVVAKRQRPSGRRRKPK